MHLSDIEKFQRECEFNILAQGQDKELAALSNAWVARSAQHKYVYNWRWCGLPIIQLPTDVMVMQEIIWRTRPDIIIETGIARGGSLVFCASLLALLDLADDAEELSIKSKRRVVGIDIDIREHNREAIKNSPFSNRIDLIEGSSTEHSVIEKVKCSLSTENRVMVVLDSNHTHEHVLLELQAYGDLVSTGCYLIVHDTSIEYAPAEIFKDRPWKPGNSPKSALDLWTQSHPQFEVQNHIDDKLLFSSSRGGYLLRKS
jgi:cephalosporin hydroxylase